MHTNPRFNIIQAPGNCNPNFVIIDGQRMPGGYPATGARTLSGPSMPRDQAIALADKLQALADTHQAELRAACQLEAPAQRRAACDDAHGRFEAACAAAGVDPFTL